MSFNLFLLKRVSIKMSLVIRRSPNRRFHGLKIDTSIGCDAPVLIDTPFVFGTRPAPMEIDEKFSVETSSGTSSAFKERIGSGVSATIYKVDTGNRVFVEKVFNADRVSVFKNEYQIAKRIEDAPLKNRRAYLVEADLSISSSYVTTDNCFIAYDYCEGGDLFATIRELDSRNASFDERVGLMKDVAGCILSALEGLAIANIIHKDVKPLNIFKSNGVWKLGDYGGSAIGDRNTDFCNYTPFYMSPRSSKEKNFIAKDDLWALGVTLYQILFGASSHPYVSGQVDSQYHIVGLINKNIDIKKSLMDRFVERSYNTPVIFDFLIQLFQMKEIDDIMEHDALYE